MTQEKLNAREALKALVEAVEIADIAEYYHGERFEKAYQNALTVLQEPADTAPAEAKAVATLSDERIKKIAGYHEFVHHGLWVMPQAQYCNFARTLLKEACPTPAPAAAEADKRDAERYRFIRDGGEGTDIAVREFDDDGDEVWIHGYPPEELDAAIDDAIAAQKEAGK